MIRFERTRDMGVVRQIMTHPSIYPWIVGDDAPPAEHYQPPDIEGIWYMLIYDDAELLGLFMLVPTTNVCIEIHTCILPHGRGDRALAAYRAGIQWIWDNTGSHKVIGIIPGYNRAAVKIALKSGCEVIGINRRAQKKFGKLQDLVIVGIERGHTNG